MHFSFHVIVYCTLGGSPIQTFQSVHAAEAVVFIHIILDARRIFKGQGLVLNKCEYKQRVNSKHFHAMSLMA